MKVVVFGFEATGKSSLVGMFVNKMFRKYSPEDEFYEQEVVVDGVETLVEILDSAGGERKFLSMHDLYIKNGEGFVIVYSISAMESFKDCIERKMEQIFRVKGKRDVPLVLVGNKCDLEDSRQVSRSQGESMARLYGCSFYETSAKTGENVDGVFMDIARQILKKKSKLVCIS